jgi:phosphatidate phosphatase PAH1
MGSNCGACDCLGIGGTDTHSLFRGQALDVIIVQNSDPNDRYASCNDFSVSFSGKQGLVRIQLNGIYICALDMVAPAKGTCRFIQGHTQKPSSEGLQRLMQALDPNQSSHPLCFHLLDSNSSEVLGTAEANLFLWSSNDRILVCDIDGTITKSNVRGLWDTVWVDTYDHIHPDIARFLNHITSERHHVVYVTSRPLSLLTKTRKFLKTFQQHSITLPVGPIFCNPKGLAAVLVSELLWKDIYLDKREILISQIVLPFEIVGTAVPLVAGFGNSVTDTMAYEMAGISLSCIYQINQEGIITCFDKTPGSTYSKDKPLDCALFEGRSFRGYQDPELLADVQSKINQQ